MQIQPDSSAIALLRQSTWPCHQRLEKRLEVKTRFSSDGVYREHLEKMWGFCAPLERHVWFASMMQALPDHELRRKEPLLANDLVTLGANSESVLNLPQCETLPDCGDDIAMAFGCAYVMEGATLGGRTLLALVRKQLGYTPEHGAQFLASHGEHTMAMWHTFGAALNAWCTTASRRHVAVSGALGTFEALEVWLCGPEA